MNLSAATTHHLDDAIVHIKALLGNPLTTGVLNSVLRDELGLLQSVKKGRKQQQKLVSQRLAS